MIRVVALHNPPVKLSSYDDYYVNVHNPLVQRVLKGKTPEARAVILTAPGEESQVDYGSGPMVRDPHSDRYRRTRRI